MSPARFIFECASDGVSFATAGNRLQFIAAPGMMNPERLLFLRGHKQDVIDLVARWDSCLIGIDGTDNARTLRTQFNLTAHQRMLQGDSTDVADAFALNSIVDEEGAWIL